MKRDWKKYIKRNKPGYGDCQLISALNAYYYLTGKQYCIQESDEYEKLVDLSRCRAGSAISIDKIHTKLGLEIIWSGNSFLSLSESLKSSHIPLPIEWNIWAWGYGFHSTLIVDYVSKCRCFRVTNFIRETNPEGWMFEWDMHKYSNFSNERGNELFRLFSLKGNHKNRSVKLQWKKQQKQFLETYKDFYKHKLKEFKEK